MVFLSFLLRTHRAEPYHLREAGKLNQRPWLFPGDLMRELEYEDIAEPLELTDEQVTVAVEMDGRYRAVTLDAPHGWII